MEKKVRRVVTGHDAQGRAMVMIDDILPVFSRRPGQSASVVWTSLGGRADNNGETDEALRKVATSVDEGTVFRIIEYQPGVSPRPHRSVSLDYAVVLSGEIDMQLDDTEVHLKAGDVLVQRGTIHNFVNRGTVPCRIAFVLVGAKPVSVGGKKLDAAGGSHDTAAYRPLA
jgi:mannose-6-phosphate isomerase-like protein (cupin superfamily)